MATLLTHDLDYKHIEIYPLSGAIGAEIYGVDIANGLSTAVFEEVQRAFSDFGVIFFRKSHSRKGVWLIERELMPSMFFI